MASTFPTSIDNFTDPLSTSPLNSPSHSSQHANLNSAVNKIETYMGLMYVTSASATSGTVLNMTSVFNSTYDNYRVLVTSVRGATAIGLNMQLGTGTATNTGYYWAGMYLSGYTVAPTVTTHGNANTTIFETPIVCGTAEDGGGVIEIQNPNLARQTEITCLGVDGRASGSPRMSYTGFQSASTQFTSLHISAATGFTNVVVTVYGYRK